MEKITDEMLKQLDDRKFGDYSNVQYSEEYEDFDYWIKEGKPRTWAIVEEYQNYKVLEDSSYGLIALFDSEELVDIHTQFITYINIVVLDKHYYNLSKYIWH
jgi:hypothetical protein